MEINVCHFEIRVCAKRLGFVLVSYQGLLLKCELVYYPQDAKAWIRMPEYWQTPKNRVWACRWENPEKSDDFQKSVLNKIFDMYSLNFEALRDLHSEWKIRKQKKKTRQYTKK